MGRAVASRMSPAPPNLSSRSPSARMPATKADATWSAQPATTGVPAARPVAAAAAGVTPPITSCERRTGGSTRRLDVAERDEVGGRRAGREVDEARLERPVLLERPDAGEAPVEVVVGAEHGRDAGEHLGLVALQPAQPGRDQLLVDAVAGAPDELGRVELGAQLLDLAPAAAVALLDAAAQQPAALVEQHHRRQHAGHADRRDVRCPAGRPGPAARGSPRRHSPTTARGPPRPSRDGRRCRSVGREASASVWPPVSIRMPIVEVVPMSSPIVSAIASAQLPAAPAKPQLINRPFSMTSWVRSVFSTAPAWRRPRGGARRPGSLFLP